MLAFILLYLFVSIEKIAAFLAIGSTIAGWAFLALLVLMALPYAMANKDTYNEWVEKLKWKRRSAYAFVFAGLLMATTSSLLPDKKELALIIGGGAIYTAVTSDTAKEFGGKAVELLRREIDEALNEVPEYKEAAKEVIKKEVKEVTAEVLSK